MSDLNVVDAAPVASDREIGAVPGGEVITTNIKIRFKKGAVSLVASGHRPGIGSKATTKLAIRLSPGRASKRKAVEEADAETVEHAVKRVKTGEAALDSTTEPSDSKAQTTNNRAASPAHSTATTTTATIQTPPPPKKGPIQAASIYRKLARKLADQPLLLDDLKAYRTALTAQRHNDAKNITSLRTALSAAARDTAAKDTRAAEDLRAAQDMVGFWTDACNKEFERAELVEERVRGFVGEIEMLMIRAGVLGEAGADSAKDCRVERELWKIVARMNGVVGGVGLEDGGQREREV